MAFQELALPQEAVEEEGGVRSEPPRERFPELGALAAQAGPREISHDGPVAFPGDEGLEARAARDPEDVRRDAAELDVPRLQPLVDASCQSRPASR